MSHVRTLYNISCLIRQNLIECHLACLGNKTYILLGSATGGCRPEPGSWTIVSIILGAHRSSSEEILGTILEDTVEHSYGPSAPPELSPSFEAWVLKVPHCEARCPSRDFRSRRNVVESVACRHRKELLKRWGFSLQPLTGVHEKRSAASRLSRNLLCVTKRLERERNIS